MKNRQNHPNDPRTYVRTGPVRLPYLAIRHVEALLAGDRPVVPAYVFNVTAILDPRFLVLVTRVRLFRPFIQATT